MDNLIEELKEVIAKHDKPKEVEKFTNPVLRWIPICDSYNESSYASVLKEKGGDTISIGKHGVERKVIQWVQVMIDPYKQRAVTIISVEK